MQQTSKERRFPITFQRSKKPVQNNTEIASCHECFGQQERKEQNLEGGKIISIFLAPVSMSNERCRKCIFHFFAILVLFQPLCASQSETPSAFLSWTFWKVEEKVLIFGLTFDLYFVCGVSLSNSTFVQ